MAGMNRTNAVTSAKQLAEGMAVNLGKCLYARTENVDSRGDDWVLLFTAPFCPTGWRWLAIVNEYAADEWLLVAIKHGPYFQKSEN